MRLQKSTKLIIAGSVFAALVPLTQASAQQSGLVPPGNAKSFKRIELNKTYTGGYYPCGGATGFDLQLWQTQPDCGTGGTKSGTTQTTAPPIIPPSGDKVVRQYAMTYDGTSGAGVRWFDDLTNTGSQNIDVYTHFQYDVWVYFADQTDVNAIYNLEMDLNQTVAGTDPQCGTYNSTHECLYIFATQCNMHIGNWQLGNHWPLTANQTCSRTQFQPGWHHVQIQFYRGPNPGDGITFYANAIDGQIQYFTCGSPAGPCTISGPEKASNWAANLVGPNFQLDGEAGYTSLTTYADDFTIYGW